ncbi:MAG: nucleoside hydrolase [Bacteroidaceae bacterium]|nr:nucleoside hydrolase [Bacteroidaceae bacterium]
MKSIITTLSLFILLSSCHNTQTVLKNKTALSPETVLKHLHNGKKKKVIIDSDTYNEMDDQYAIAYALGNPNLEILSVNAAPFHNNRSTDFGDGMKKSYDEIVRVLRICGKDGACPIWEGSKKRIGDKSEIEPAESPAADNIIKLAKRAKEPIYILCLGAATNVASAILMEPSIKDKIVVVWLGTNFADAGHQGEFNLVQDYRAGQVLLNSGVQLILLPASGKDNKGTQVLSVDQEEVKAIKENTEAGRFFRKELPREFKQTSGNWWHILWDIAAPGLISRPDAFELEVIPSPVLTEDRQLVEDHTRHKIIRMNRVDPKAIRSDAFKCINTLR